MSGFLSQFLAPQIDDPTVMQLGGANAPAAQSYRTSELANFFNGIASGIGGGGYSAMPHQFSSDLAAGASGGLAGIQQAKLQAVQQASAGQQLQSGQLGLQGQQQQLQSGALSLQQQQLQSAVFRAQYARLGIAMPSASGGAQPTAGGMTGAPQQQGQTTPGSAMQTPNNWNMYSTLPRPVQSMVDATTSLWPQNIAAGIIHNESGGNVNQTSGDNGQAFGFTQMHAGALADVNKALGTNYTTAQLSDPANAALATTVAGRYWNMQRQQFGNDATATVAYNYGPEATAKWQQQTGGDFSKLPNSVQQYVSNVMGPGSVPGATPSTAALQAHMSANTPAVAPSGVSAPQAPYAGDPFAGFMSRNPQELAQQPYFKSLGLSAQDIAAYQPQGLQGVQAIQGLEAKRLEAMTPTTTSTQIAPGTYANTDGHGATTVSGSPIGNYQSGSVIDPATGKPIAGLLQNVDTTGTHPATIDGRAYTSPAATENARLVGAQSGDIVKQLGDQAVAARAPVPAIQTMMAALNTAKAKGIDITQSNANDYLPLMQSLRNNMGDAAYASMFGDKSVDKLTLQEVFDKSQQSLALSAKPPGQGHVSNIQTGIIGRSMPSLSMNENSIRAIAGIMQQTADAKARVSDAANQWIADPSHNNSMAGFWDYVNQNKIDQIMPQIDMSQGADIGAQIKAQPIGSTVIANNQIYIVGLKGGIMPLIGGGK